MGAYNEFQKTRINAQNFRKEFFRVSIDQVEEAVERLALGEPFFKDVDTMKVMPSAALASPTCVQAAYTRGSATSGQRHQPQV